MHPILESGAALLRAGGALLLGMALLYAFVHFPTQPEQDWQSIHLFGLDSDQCEAFLDQRLTTDLLVPEQLVAPVTIADVAEKFSLELKLVCEANERPADCGAETLAPGVDTLILPLYYGSRSVGRLEGR